VIPAGWTIERAGDGVIRITDPHTPAGPLLIYLHDQAIVMRIFWRLCSELIDAAPAAQSPAHP
jgi:hypothetical protein